MIFTNANNIMLKLLTITLLLTATWITITWAANPIDRHREGPNGQALYVHAVIRPGDIGTGQDTSKNKTMAALVRAMGRGSWGGDDCGHVVASVLGGPMKLYNLFPQNLSKNRGEFKSTVEAHVQKFLQKFNKLNDYVDYEISLVYARPEDTRPTGLKFRAKFYKGGKLASSFKSCKMCSKYLLDSMDRFGDDLCEVLLSYLSFEDRFRFGDDLCEVLLSYLSFEDRFRCECVSTQWQRLAFNTQNHISIGYENAFQSLVEVKNSAIFETIVKKLQNIKSLEIGDDGWDELLRNTIPMIQIMIFTTNNM
ncbi:unnamed protein product [Medioppia subpectinata]|uniref:Uncharacterized protein n=1 Tax=Medioppia subpectinata TaxID=1979941 RepID=A0A7R9KZW6_9ACAR|nr:unnamed protein product [Medioppia subpectinata]CAG2112679.1 unnamed protein product [Medioppia subpectinata]